MIVFWVTHHILGRLKFFWFTRWGITTKLPQLADPGFPRRGGVGEGKTPTPRMGLPAYYFGQFPNLYENEK